MKFVDFNGTVIEPKMFSKFHFQIQKDKNSGKESITTLHNGIIYVFSSERECNYGISLYSATSKNGSAPTNFLGRFNRIFHKESEIMPFIEELHKIKNIDEVYDIIKKAQQTYKMNKDEKTK